MFAEKIAEKEKAFTKAAKEAKKQKREAFIKSKTGDKTNSMTENVETQTWSFCHQDKIEIQSTLDLANPSGVTKQ